MNEDMSDRRKGLFLQDISLRLGLIVSNGSPELPNQVVAFREQRIDTALTLWDIWTNIELAINPHVINGIELISLVEESLERAECNIIPSYCKGTVRAS